MDLSEMPHDPEGERQLLSLVLLVDDAVSHDEMYDDVYEFLADIQVSDFADPFHAWLYGKLREAREVWPGDLRQQLRFVLARPIKREAAKEFSEDNLALVIAKLYVDQSGSGCAWPPNMCKILLNHLRRIAMHRDHVTCALQELQRAYEQWHSLVRSGRHRASSLDPAPANRPDSGARASENSWQPSVDRESDHARRRLDRRMDARSEEGRTRRLF